MIEFTKMQALGNDYIYFDCTKKNLSPENLPKLAMTLSDRHFGIGADGIILILPSNVADFRMGIFNSDSSEAQMCGNGIRCVGKYIYEKKLSAKNNLTIETLAGIKKLYLDIENNLVKQITVDMGKPNLESDVNLTAYNRDFQLTCISMGNPHAVTVIENLDSFDAQKYGKIIESDVHFPQKTNVEFIEIVDRNTIKIKVYERGSGITMACGTGACAACTAAALKNLVNKNENIKVIFPGGDLYIKWQENIFMMGDAHFVFDGQIQLKENVYEYQ